MFKNSFIKKTFSVFGILSMFAGIPVTAQATTTFNQEMQQTLASATDVAIFDMTGDGNDDIFAVSSTGVAHLFIGDGQGGFTSEETLTVASGAVDIDVLDNDNVAIASTSGTVTVATYGSSLTAQFTILNPGGMTAATDVSKINGNDIVVRGDSGIYLLTQASSYTTATVIAAGSTFEVVGSDIAVHSFNPFAGGGSVAVYDQAGVLGTVYTLTNISNSVVMEYGDVTNNNSDELIIIDSASNTIQIEGGAPVTLTGIADAVDMAIVDYNNDGNNELAIVDVTGNTVKFYDFDGTTLTLLETVATGDFPENVAFGDINDDGNLDMATADAHDNQLSIFFYEPNSIGDIVFFDENENGEFDNGEDGISGVEVTLVIDANNDGIIDQSELDIAVTTVTNSDGEYEFEDVVLGLDYIVMIDLVSATNAPLLDPASGTYPIWYAGDVGENNHSQNFEGYVITDFQGKDFTADFGFSDGEEGTSSSSSNSEQRPRARRSRPGRGAAPSVLGVSTDVAPATTVITFDDLVQCDCGDARIPELQKALASQGLFDHPTFTECFGSKTRDGLESFMLENGQSVTYYQNPGHRHDGHAMMDEATANYLNQFFNTSIYTS